MTKTIVIIATVDTKGSEAFFLNDLARKRGYHTILIDVSCRDRKSSIGDVDISNRDVADAAGLPLHQLRRGVKGDVASKMAEGVSKIVTKLYDEGKVDGVLGIGGSVGAEISTAAMRSLPVGLPKICISTIQQTRSLVGSKDIAMLYPVTDLSGGRRINRFEKRVLTNAVGAIAGMIEMEKPRIDEDRPLLLASMFGSTTPCVRMTQEILEDEGYEVAVFHAQGSGGRAIEEFVRGGGVSGVLDITLSELASELAGAPLTAGSDRLEAAADKGVPQVICPGALDIIPFLGITTIPSRYKDRFFHQHSPSIVNMRTSKEESIELAKIVSRKLNKAEGPTAIVVPERGWSEYDLEGGVICIDASGRPTSRPWYDREADEAFTEALRGHLDKSNENLTLITVDTHINDPSFASKVAAIMMEMLQKSQGVR